ncbi:MAG TPA: glycoside hydrolase family 9 protein [Candidatus Didemnitutus sp.]|nr:glycoside hydrolase family 9 protein [Candidatus Didemnitutus sp.]
MPELAPGAFLRLALLVPACAALGARAAETPNPDSLALNDRGYFEKPGLNVMLGSDYYREGHQGGVGIIQNGLRVATNGDLRLDPTPGQWQPISKAGDRAVDAAHQEIHAHFAFPDETQDRKGFNPISYPDLKLGYTVRVTPAGGDSFRIVVDLDAPLPAAWVGKVGFNLEFFPGLLFGKSYALGNTTGMFPRQPNGPGTLDDAKIFQAVPLARGPGRLVIAPESEDQRLTIETVHGGELSLLDGRFQHNNGWFVVRAPLAGGATTGALEWLVTPHAIPGWRSAPVVQVSEVGYHPGQPKVAVIECDPRDTAAPEAELQRVSANGGFETVLHKAVVPWGNFLRYRYARFDFSEMAKPGIYRVRYGSVVSDEFQINDDVYDRDVWQPTVGTFLAVQMCHMRVNDRYRVWHGLCHTDDALMAPLNHNHFDGYKQGPSTLTTFKSGDHVPGLDRGGWHDAGDYDVRIESQVDTVHGLALAWELFHPMFDDTTIDENLRVAELHHPDGKPDILQQIEHGVLSIVGGYKSMGRLYRGMQDPALRIYTNLGDAANMTDNQVFHDPTGRAMAILAAAAVNGDQSQPAIPGLPPLGSRGSADDRWVFTEENPFHDLDTAAGLAAASRALRGYNNALADDCRRIAVELWDHTKEPRFPLARLEPAIELYQTTGDERYAQVIRDLSDEVVKRATLPVETPERFIQAAWLGARTLPLIKDPVYREKIRGALRAYRAKVDALARETPYGIPYQPDIWGAGWDIERFGVEQYFLHREAPDIFPATYVFDALNFILGCHPGSNTASFVSGVGTRSTTTAYGANRADASYIPGGTTSGTALIRPDYPELLEWPYLWQQTEYCLGYPTSDYVFLVLATQQMLH